MHLKEHKGTILSERVASLSSVRVFRSEASFTPSDIQGFAGEFSFLLITLP
jgi:hypothetical protein